MKKVDRRVRRTRRLLRDACIALILEKGYETITVEEITERADVGRTTFYMHYRDKEDVWTIKREYWHGKDKTPTKLPSEIIRKILQYSSDECDLVLDPFLGSGQVAFVSKELGRKYLGFEIVDEYFSFAQKRLAEINQTE